jgi:uncharacterized radical SAM protein YgiQ
MIATTPNPSGYDVILISGDYWADHPHSGVGVIARVLEYNGFSVGIIEKPKWNTTEDFKRLGLPHLFFGITSGAIDSMMVNYTPLKKERAKDPYKPFNSGIPDRAVIVYAQKTREAMKELCNGDLNLYVPIILGGVEASLRRFTHYDYWKNCLSRPILFDAKADLLVYGMGEYQIVEIAKRLRKKESIIGIQGTCIISKDKPNGMLELPAHETLLQDKKEFCKFTLQLSNEKDLIEPVEKRYLIQYKMHEYSSDELDAIFSLPFTYTIPEQFREFEMAEFSIITHRGCFGACNFCSIALHQGKRIISRSEANIIQEIKRMQNLKHFKGTITDLGGPSANMYGMDCTRNCGNDCMKCKNIDRDQSKSTELLKKVRLLPGIKHSFVTSGIRYDLAVDADEYLKELSNHISGCLKIAPEHFSPRVLLLMNKDNSHFVEFKRKFETYNASRGQTLRYYFMTAHPGSTMEDAEMLRKLLSKLENIENVQIFTPTPMSISTCMYYTGLNPFTMKPVYVPYSYNEKKKQKHTLFRNNED